MEPWTQPITAPHQPDVTDDPSALEGVPRVERGWMEDPRPSRAVSWGRRRDSLGIDAFTAGVVLLFILLMLVFLPYLLFRTV